MTDLSETIARLEDGIALETNHPGSVRISPECARSLLAAARRVQAMEGTPLDGRKFLEEYAAKARAFDLTKTADEIQVILDLASDQSAARAEVERLRNAQTNAVEARAEVVRLRKLAQDEMRDQAVIRIQLEERAEQAERERDEARATHAAAEEVLPGAQAAAPSPVNMDRLKVLYERLHDLQRLKRLDIIHDADELDGLLADVDAYELAIELSIQKENPIWKRMDALAEKIVALHDGEPSRKVTYNG